MKTNKLRITAEHGRSPLNQIFIDGEKLENITGYRFDHQLDCVPRLTVDLLIPKDSVIEADGTWRINGITATKENALNAIIELQHYLENEHGYKIKFTEWEEPHLD